MSAVGSILTNTGALQALNSIATTSNLNNTLEGQLSSGKAIGSPADNPAGYITAQGFTSQLNGITQAISNANTGVSLLQTAQGAITQQIGVVQQLNSIAVQAANGTQTPAEAQSLQTVVGQLTSQVNTIATQTQFNNISLLNGSFSGVQFQVGANEGQTQTLSISNLSASAIGLNASTVSSAAAIYALNVKSTSAALTVATAAQLAAGSGGKFTAFAAAGSAGAVTITGPQGGQATIYNSASQVSAATLAASINAVSGTSGVAAQATTSIKFTLGTAGSAGAGYSFKIQAGTGTGSTNSSGIGTLQTISASSAAQIVSQINGDSSTSGIIASYSNSSKELTLTQTTGDNINITGFSSGSLKTLGSGGANTTTTALSTANASAVIQGQVQFQSSGAFSLTNGANLGLATKSTLSSLSDINVTTTTGANSAINVVKYALATLNNQGGQLGAVQQALTANINNLNTTAQNLNSALGVVQDANIPSVANQLTEAQIQAQSGVAALKASTQLQQSYLSLLP
jgi:flagellin